MLRDYIITLFAPEKVPLESTNGLNFPLIPLSFPRLMCLDVKGFYVHKRVGLQRRMYVHRGRIRIERGREREKRGRERKRKKERGRERKDRTRERKRKKREGERSDKSDRDPVKYSPLAGLWDYTVHADLLPSLPCTAPHRSLRYRTNCNRPAPTPSFCPSWLPLFWLMWSMLRGRNRTPLNRRLSKRPRIAMFVRLLVNYKPITKSRPKFVTGRPPRPGTEELTTGRGGPSKERGVFFWPSNGNDSAKLTILDQHPWAGPWSGAFARRSTTNYPPNVFLILCT